jgi:hypothetical protein
VISRKENNKMLNQKYIEQMREGLRMMRKACENIPYSECCNCPFYPNCGQEPESMPAYWEENQIST